MTLDLRDVPASGRNIRPTDTAFGWEHALTSEIAARRSSWQQVLELAGLYVQFSENNSTWADTATVDATHFRLASGTEKPADGSVRWSAGIALGGAVSLSFSDITGTIADSQIPDAIMRDAEFTATAVRNLLNLTAAEVNDLLTGATIVGQVLTFAQNDGTTVAITIPTATAGTGDGVVESGAFDSAGNNLTLTLDTGGTVTINVPAALRASGGVTEARVQEIVNATALSALQGMVTDGQIPDAIMRDAEFTAAALRTLLGLSQNEVNDLLTGATIAGQILTFTQNDGTVVAITIPTAMAGTGDGVVQSGALSGTDLVLTLDNAGTVTIDIAALATDIELTAYAALTGATFTGMTEGLDPTSDQGFVTKAYADANYAVFTPTPMHDLICGWSPDAAISDAEITAGAMSMTNTVTIPDATGTLYLFIWRADVDGGDPLQVFISGGLNVRNTLTAAVARTVDSIPGQLLVGVQAWNAGLNSSESLMVV